MRVIKLIVLLLGAVALPQAGWGADSVVLGRALSNRGAADAESPCGEPQPDTICMRGWFHWTLVVDQTLSGPSIHGRVVAARTQHTSVASSAMKRSKVFVLRPIDDPQERQRVRASYFLVDMSWPNYCLEVDPTELGLDVEYVYVDRSGERSAYCFVLREAE